MTNISILYWGVSFTITFRMAYGPVWLYQQHMQCVHFVIHSVEKGFFYGWKMLNSKYSRFDAYWTMRMTMICNRNNNNNNLMNEMSSCRRQLVARMKRRETSRRERRESKTSASFFRIICISSSLHIKRHSWRIWFFLVGKLSSTNAIYLPRISLHNFLGFFQFFSLLLIKGSVKT